MRINSKIKKYIEKEILPEYKKNEIGHGIDHIKYVIDRSLDIVKKNKLDVNIDMVYVIAAYHDIGHYIDAKNHEKVSSEMLLADTKLKDFFSDEEISIIKRARNHKGVSHPKNCDIVTYKYATGLEALIGYYDLINNNERIDEIMNFIFNCDIC